VATPVQNSFRSPTHASCSGSGQPSCHVIRLGSKASARSPPTPPERSAERRRDTDARRPVVWGFVARPRAVVH
jgi:hypothetical protein